MINDKSLYAMHRCLSIMCAGERFGIYKLGDLQGLSPITAASLWRYYGDVISANRQNFVVGIWNHRECLIPPQRFSLFPAGPERRLCRKMEIFQPVKEVKFQEEQLPVSQAKLILGYRTNIPLGDELFYPLMVYNGILGGFPHSKLFMNVRERASLAYYVYSQLERHKGIMVIAAGIEGANYEKARGIIEQQIDDMVHGRISPLEMENTKRGLVNQLRTQEDSPFQKINFFLDRSIGGQKESTGEMIEKIEAVSVEQVREAAAKIELDTVYLLQGREGEGAS